MHYSVVEGVDLCRFFYHTQITAICNHVTWRWSHPRFLRMCISLGGSAALSMSMEAAKKAVPTLGYWKIRGVSNMTVQVFVTK